MSEFVQKLSTKTMFIWGLVTVSEPPTVLVTPGKDVLKKKTIKNLTNPTFNLRLFNEK